MADQQSSLAHPFVLGFIGDQEVHRENSRALLKDLISAYLRQNKGAEVRFVLPAMPFTDTMDELADFCYTSGYQLEFVAHNNLIPERWEGHADVSSVPDEVPLWQGLVGLLAGEPESRLILVADPNVDDAAYGATFTAINRNVKVRSLLVGLDIVLFTQNGETENEEERAADMPPRDEDYEYDEDEAEVDDEIEEDEEEESDEEEEEEEEEDEGVEAEDEDEVDDEDGVEVEDEDLDEEEAEAEDEEPEEEEEVPATAAARTRRSTRTSSKRAPRAAKRATKKTAKRATVAPINGGRLTRTKLQRMADRDRDEFLEVAASHGVERGRGIKIATMISRVLEAQDDGKAPRTAKRAATKSTTTRKRVATVRKRTAASSNSKQHTPSVEVKAAIRAAKAFIEVVEASLG